MSKTMGGALAVTALMLVGAGALQGQEDVAPRPGLGRGADAEMIMAMRDRLELTEEQITALDEIRRETVALRSSHRSAMEEMRSRFRAGEIERSELMAFMEDLRSSAPATREQRRERIEAVLNEAQIETLDQIRSERRAFRRGRASAFRGGEQMRGRRGPAMRDGRGFGRGMRPGATSPRGGGRPLRIGTSGSSGR